MRKLLIGLVLLTFFTALNSEAQETSSFDFLGMHFKLINPNHSKEKKPLLLLLHGCKQNADLIIEGTGLSEEAVKRNFFLLVPEQSILMNSDHCWNWFYSFQQMKGVFNEMNTFVSAIENLSLTYPIDHSRIFVAGISAGGAMAHNLVACYPDVFSGAAIHSGLAYKTAENIFEANTVLTASKQKSAEYLGTSAYQCGHDLGIPSKLKKILIIQGLADQRVPPLHADLISATDAVLDDLIDDQMINHSDLPKVTEQSISSPVGYDVHITDKNYKSFSERKILVNGLQHAWGGGKPLSANFDPKAPSSNLFILNYFGL